MLGVEPTVPLLLESWLLPIVPELAPGVPTVELLEPVVPWSVPAVVPVPVPVVPVVPCALPDVPAPADPPEPLWPKAATETTIAPAARNVAIFSLTLIDSSSLWDSRSYGRPTWA